MDWSGFTFNFGPGTENWRIDELTTQQGTGVLVDSQLRRQSSSDGTPTHSSLMMTDARGTQSGEADTNHGLFTASTLADILDPRLAHAHIDSAAWFNTKFLVSGEGQGTLTLSIPYTLHLTRDASIPSIHGLAEGAMTSLSFGVNGQSGSRQSDLLRWDDSSLQLTRQGTLTLSHDFLNPQQTAVILVGLVGAHDMGTNVPEPSTWLLLAVGMGLVMWRLYSRRMALQTMMLVSAVISRRR